jgi:hypothetical protein
MPFRLLAHVARCAEGSGAAAVTLSGVATACGTTEARTRQSLRELSAAGLVRVRWDGETAHVTFTGPMIAEGGQPALVVPAWLDDAGLSAAAFRLAYHYVRRAREGRVDSRREKASELCGLSRRGVGIAERELVARGLLEPRGSGGVFGLTLATAAQGGGVVYRTVQCVRDGKDGTPSLANKLLTAYSDASQGETGQGRES